jgi:zinc transport system substrate-binding protein
VAGERGEANLLLPPGAEIHTWKPRASDIIKLSSADLFIYVGASLEPWLDDILASTTNSNLRILEASHGLSLIRESRDEHNEHEHKRNAADPHVWLDFENDKIVVDRIQELLSEIDPEGESIFKKNAALYKKKLQELDQNYRKSLRNCLKRTFILGGHAAFAYLARRYSLNQISLYGLSPDSKPTPKHLVEVIELAKEHEIKVIYFESHISDELAKVMAKEVGSKTLVLNSGANITKEQMKSGVTFLEIMKINLENLKDGLVCD